ncbi:hypothetical protein J3Q64DRAFT_1737375 [Phycomyces blakesleeanus]|uniref:Golgi apparatus membrane protein TVP18 n=2 Tax=Phycomyces blakesleeanus TaxID=4837 RepID=A0A167LPU3_PHYB8|nr:hypothetical protein PHYBLDRAFT_77579 [Phycomyces blakesleeanus NRRL 1555(-)]OAD70869.1 hypothetical protein PHYBLDRAFT_77579 [Phycomyces blakesleeanus NRRL 1555(-)]|eukprot:XP_018288909.1 hypothetical protein PHYBLDRAFT_77579 [Phycomyces blakesleeanus NRRL 1555(-)]
MGIFAEFASRNFSLYAQWFGLVSIVLLIALGVVSLISNLVFAIIGWVIAFILVFVEVPLCTKFCPTSPKFDGFVSTFENSYLRAGLYLVFAIVMFLSRTISTTTLIIPGVTLLLAAISYGIAGFKQQPHASTTMLGGTGVDNIV